MPYILAEIAENKKNQLRNDIRLTGKKFFPNYDFIFS